MPMTLALALRGSTGRRRARPSSAAPPPPAGNVTLTFASATTDAEAGVSGVAGATNANLAFAFTEVVPRLGLPCDLEISEGGTLKLVVTFPDDYSGDSYTYTDTAGGTHAGTFPSGSGTVNY